MHHFDYVQQNYNIGKYFHVTLLTQIKNTTRVLVKRKIIVISIKYKNIHSNNINKCTKINVLSLIYYINKKDWIFYNFLYMHPKFWSKPFKYNKQQY